MTVPSGLSPQLTAVALVCTLKPSPAESSSQLFATQLLDELTTHNVTGTAVRVVDFDIRPGVDLDMGDGDEWPRLREQIVAADIFQSLTDVGFTIPSQGATYWNGEAMGSVDYKDPDETPEATARTNASVANTAAHLARMLRQSPYPP